MKRWIWGWIGVNILDLAITFFAAENGRLVPWLEFAAHVELNPLIRLFPYPEGLVTYKIFITLAMIPIMNKLSVYYNDLPNRLIGLFITVWLFGVFIAGVAYA